MDPQGFDSIIVSLGSLTAEVRGGSVNEHAFTEEEGTTTESQKGNSSLDGEWLWCRAQNPITEGLKLRSGLSSSVCGILSQRVSTLTRQKRVSDASNF